MKKVIVYTLSLTFAIASLQAEPTPVGGVSVEAVQTAKNRQRLSWGIALCAVIAAAAGLAYLGTHHHSHSH